MIKEELSARDDGTFSAADCVQAVLMVSRVRLLLNTHVWEIGNKLFFIPLIK